MDSITGEGDNEEFLDENQILKNTLDDKWGENKNQTVLDRDKSYRFKRDGVKGCLDDYCPWDSRIYVLGVDLDDLASSKKSENFEYGKKNLDGLYDSEKFSKDEISQLMESDSVIEEEIGDRIMGELEMYISELESSHNNQEIEYERDGWRIILYNFPEPIDSLEEYLSENPVVPEDSLNCEDLSLSRKK